MPEGYRLAGVCYQESRRLCRRIQQRPELVQFKLQRLLADWELVLPDQEIDRRVAARREEMARQTAVPPALDESAQPPVPQRSNVPDVFSHMHQSHHVVVPGSTR